MSKAEAKRTPMEAARIGSRLADASLVDGVLSALAVADDRAAGMEVVIPIVVVLGEVVIVVVPEPTTVTLDVGRRVVCTMVLFTVEGL